MAKKKARLGRGLGALLGDVKTTTRSDPETVVPEAAPVESAEAQGVVTGFREMPVEMLERGRYQPRIRMDKEALAELGESIKSQGVLQPLLVRPLSRGRFEIIAGERRWRGAQIAGLNTVPVVVREIPDQTAMAVWSGISLTTTGTVFRPAICAPRQRRSPAIISNRPRLNGRTSSGCSTPWDLMDSPSSARASLSILIRGW